MKNKLVLFALIFSISFCFISQSRSQWDKTHVLNSTSTVTCFAVIDNNLYAGTNGLGVLLSSDNGDSWVSLNNGLASTPIVSALAVVGANLYAVAISSNDAGGIFLSTDEGVSWAPASNGLTNTLVSCLIANGGNIFAGTIGGGVFLSSDNGTNWSAVNAGLTNLQVRSLLVSGGNLFAGGESGVFLSTNNGTSWTLKNNGLNILVGSLTMIGSSLFAAGGAGVYLSTDDGNNWTDKSIVVNGSPVTVELLTSSGTNLFAGTFLDGVFLSTDSGTSWTAENSGLPPSLWVESLGVSGSNLFLGSGENSNAGNRTDTDIWSRPISQMIAPSAVTQTPPSPPQIQSYPNPFTQSTTVTFSSQSAGFAEVTVVNLLGAQVAQLFSGELLAGEHSFPWNASGMAPGLYECIVRMNGQVQRISMSHLE